MAISPIISSESLSARGEKWRRLERGFAWGLLIVALLTMTFIRLRLLDMPLERDEGEYGYAGQLILQGVPPYQECYNMKWPGTYLAYAAIMALFGETPAGIHLGLLFVTLASAWLVFLIGRRIGGLGMGAVAATMEALIGVSPATYGFAGHATHFVVLPALGGILLLMAPWEDLRWARCLIAGGLFGVAGIMKQPGAVFGLFAVVWLLWRGWMERPPGSRRMGETAQRLGFLVAGASLALLAMVTWLAAAGVYGKFWHWTVEYAHAYLGVATFDEGYLYLMGTLDMLWTADGYLWILGGLGMILLWFEPTLRQWRFFLVTLTIFTLASVCPGFYFRGHYFLLLLPAASLLGGAAWRAGTGSIERFVRASANQRGKENGLLVAKAAFGALFLLAAGHSLVASRDVFFLLSPVAACRSVYGANPFLEAQEIARHIAAGCPPDARIAVIGSEPEIYFYSHRRAATGYIYTYPLVEEQPFAAEMQREMIREIERAAPEYVVYVAIPTSWMMHKGSNSAIFDWMKKYCTEEMELDGVIQLLPNLEIVSEWDMAGQRFQPRSNCWLSIFKRKAKYPVLIPLNTGAL